VIQEAKFYLSILWRRSPIILAILLPIMVATYFMAKQMPTAYQTSARLLMEAPSIPDELTALRSSNRSRERMEVIQQRLMTRANLLEIAETHRVFLPDAELSPDDVVEAMNASTSISIASGRDSATVMSIRFEGRSATLVADVVNDYVTRILREDVQLRQGQARQTEEFFQQEVDRLADELDIKSAAISAFRSENAESLPETFEFRLERLAALEERSADLTQEVLLLTERRRQLAETVVEGDPETASAQLSLERENLIVLRRELAAAMEGNAAGETSPRVRILRSRIGQIEQVIRSLGGSVDGELSASQALENQITQIDTQLSFLEQQLSELQVGLDQIEGTLEETPAISIRLADLERDYLNTQQQYNTVVERLAVAETTERIELMSRGERISILDPATVPNSPFKPNRKKLMVAGTMGGLMLALGLVLGLEFLSPLVKRPSTIEKSIGITPIAALPYIRSNRQVWFDRMVRLSILAVIFLGVPAAFWALHTYYLPLDLLADKVLDRLGV